ncbi:MAG: hypothetical protein WB425_15550 [Terracidiphilus sp.]
MKSAEHREGSRMSEKISNGIENQWDLVRRGDVEQGVALMRENYGRDPSPSYIMELGVGYLWTEKYKAAWEHFQYAMQRHPLTTDVFYGMSGAARWCIGEPDAAVSSWKTGLDAQFADAAGGVHLPLLLWVASVLRPNVLSSREAIVLLEKRVKDPRVKNWPGALAQFVLNIIDEKTLEERSIERINRIISPRRKWMIAFYKCVVELERSDLSREEFNVLMGEMSDTSISEWSQERNFLSLLWNEEFFIARHEASLPAVKLNELLKSQR